MKDSSLEWMRKQNADLKDIIAQQRCYRVSIKKEVKHHHVAFSEEFRVASKAPACHSWFERVDGETVLHETYSLPHCSVSISLVTSPL